VSARRFKIIVNGFAETVDEPTSLEKIVEAHGDGDLHAIVEKNGRYVYPQEYATVIVEPGDEIEIVHPDFGG